MRFFTSITASLLAIGVTAQSEPITQPFYLTVIIDGAEHPVNVVPVSRGVPILTPWNDYVKTFTYNPDTKRIYSGNSSTSGSSNLAATSPLYFTSDEAEEGSELVQIGEDGAMYLVKEGTEGEGSLGWKTEWRDENLPANFFWPGQGSEDANAKLRIDLKVPTS